jgi:hypothetical protein
MGQHNRFDQDAERGAASSNQLAGVPLSRVICRAGRAFSVVIAAISTSEAF